MTREIHQLVHTLSYGDAISGEVLALQRVLRDAGYSSEIFAINVHPKLEGRAQKYQQFPKDFAGEVVLHYSLGSPLNILYRSLARAKRTLVYHNLTPAVWFEGVNPRIVRDIESGAKELPALCAISSRLLADSEFNAQELQQLGFRAEVLPLPIDPERWNFPENPGIAALLRSTPGIHLLHVGRLAPNKCIDDIIKVFYFLHHYVEPQSTLWIVGIDIDTELHSFELKRLVHELDLEGSVNFAGCMADAEIKALYRNATAYLCMSEHEGFCLPLAEAMHFGLPVLAYASSAIPETVASGGILLKDKRHPEIAELIGEIYRNAEFRDKLRDAGKRQAAEFSHEHFERRVQELFSSSQTAAVATLG